MQIKSVIQRIQSLYSKGVQSDDSRLSSRHIYNKAITVRSLLLTRKHSQKQKVSQWNYQTLPCVRLVRAKPYECPCVPSSDCGIFRTENKLPSPIIGLNNHLIQSVTSLDGSTIYSEIEWEQKKYKSGNKYTRDKPDYFIRNDYLYITAKKGTSIITITGLFEDPIEANIFGSACAEDQDCVSYMDKEFYLENALIEGLVEISAQELISAFNSSIEDISNNTKDSRTDTTK